MRSSKALLILAVVAVAVVAAALWLRPRGGGEIAGSGQAVLPELARQVEALAEIVIARPAETVTLQRQGEAWSVYEKGGYPADGMRVRALLLGLADLRRLEPKTARAEHYGELGLSDLDAEGSRAVAVTLRDSGGTALASLILGDRRPGRADPSRNEVYLREPGEAQTWLVEGALPELGGALAWIDSTLLELDRGRIRAATVNHPDGEMLRVERPDAEATDFALAELPAGAEVESPFAVNSVANTFSRVTFDDVLPATEVAFPETPELSAQVETFDGLVVEAEAMRQGERWLARFAARALPASEPVPAASTDSAGTEAAEPDEAVAEAVRAAVADGDAAEGEPAGTGATTDQTADTPAAASDADPAGVEQANTEASSDQAPDPTADAARLTQRWQGWVYEPSPGWISSLEKRRSELLKPVDEEAGEQAEGND
jgi:hypothetical protein